MALNDAEGPPVGGLEWVAMRVDSDIDKAAAAKGQAGEVWSCGVVLESQGGGGWRRADYRLR